MQILSSTDRGILRRAKREETALKKRIGQIVLALRIKHGLSIRALEQKSGISRGLLSQIEHGKCNPSIETICRIAQGFGEPPEYLFRLLSVNQNAIYNQ